MRVVVGCFLFLFLPLFSGAIVTNSWVGPAAGTWTSGVNWSTGLAPAVADSVVIGPGITVTFNAAGNVTIGSLNISAGSVLNVTAFHIVTMNSLRLDGTINGASTQNFVVGNILPFALSGTGTFALSGGGNLRLNANIALKNAGDDLKITSGALLDLNGHVFTNNGKVEILDPSDFKNIAGTFTNGSATSYLLYTRQAAFPALVTLTSTAAGNTVEYASAAAGPFLMDNKASYSNLIITGSGFTKTLNAAVSTVISGNLTINSGAIFSCGAKPIKIAGNWTNNGGTFTNGASTVTFNGLAGQSINGTAAAQTFFNVVVNLTAGQTLSTGGSTVALTTNNLTETTGNFTAPATLNINSTATSALILTAGTLTAGTTINITGNWTNNGGTFSGGAGVVNFVGTSAQIINGTAAAQTFNNVVVNLTSGFALTVAGTTVTLNTNNLTLTTGNFTAPATLNITGSATATLILTAGTFTAGTTVNIKGNWTNNGGSFIPGANTVKFVGTASQQINGTAIAQTFNKFIVNLTAGQTLSTGGSTVTLTTSNLTETTGNFTAPATLNINNTVAALLTLTAGTFTAGTAINIVGNWTNNGGTFIPGANVVNFIGTGNQIINGTAIAQTFNDIVVNLTAGKILSTGGSTTILNTNNVTLTTGSFTGPATLNITATATATLTLSVAGTFTAGLAVNITGNWTNNGGTFTPGANTVKFTGSASQLINGTAAAQTFFNVIVNLTAGQNLSCGGSTVALTTNNLTETTGNFTAPATLNINKTAAASVLTLAAGTTFTAGTTINITGNWINNGGTFVPGANTVNFTGTGAQAINGTASAQTFNNVVVLKTAGQTLTTGGSTTTVTTNNLTLTTGNYTAPATLNINSTSSSTLTLTAGTFTAGANVNITGNWTNNGGVFTPGVNTVNFVGTAPQFINGTAAAQTFFNLVVNLSAGQLLTTGGSTVTLTTNNLTETTGNFTAPATLNIITTATATLTLNAGTFTAGTTINIKGNWTNNGGTFVPGLNTVNFKGTAGEIINGTAVAQSFFNVVVNMTAGQTLSTGGSTVTVNTNNLTETTGNFIAPATLNINSTATSTIILTAGTFTAGTNVNITGNWTNNGGVFVPGLNTVNFVGTAGQIINGTALAQTFHDFVVNLTAGQTLSTGGSTVTLTTNNLILTSGNFTAPATLNISNTASASLILNGGTLTAGANITIKGNWTHSGGVFTPGVNAVTFNGTATQTITDASGEIFFKLISNCTGPIVLAATTSVIATSALTMTAGSFNVPAGQSFTLGNNATSTLVHTAGEFFGPGNFRRFLPAATVISSTVAPLLGLFPVGTAASYRPIELNTTVSLTTGGLCSVTHADPGTFTELGTPGVSDGAAAPIMIQRFYDATSTISTSGIVGGTYNLNMTMTGLTPVGPTANIYLEANIAGTPTAKGITAVTGGTNASPVGKRTGLTLANLPFSFVICTNNEAVSPIEGVLYSRGSANWNLNTNWSRTNGGASCACTPGIKDSVIILSGHTITLNLSTTINTLYIKDGGTLTISAAGNALTMGSGGNLGGLTIDGSGQFTSTAAATLPMQMNGFYLNGAKVGLNSGTYSVTQDLVCNFNIATRPATVLNFAAAGNLNMGALQFTNNGTIIIGGASNLKNGTFKNTATGSLQDNANANFPAATTLDASAVGNSVSFGATSAGTYTLPSVSSFYDVTFGKLAGGVAVTYALKDPANPLSVADNLVINSTTTLDANANSVDLLVSGNWTNNGGIFNPGTRTVTFNGATPQLITNTTGETFYNLVFTGVGAKTLGGPVTTNGDLTIGVGSLLDVTTSNFALTIGGNWLDNGTFNARLGTVTFNKIGAQSITNGSGETFNILSLLGGSTKTLGGNIALTSDLTIAALTTLDAGAGNNAITIAGNWTNSGAFTPRAGTVTFNGSSPQTITNTSGETFDFLVLSGAGATTLGGGISAAANLTISSGSSLDITASNYPVNIGGNLANNGTFNTQAGTVTFNGTTAQTIGGSTLTNFNNMTLNNAAGASILGPQNLKGTLTLTTGTFTTSGQIFTLISDAAYTANIATIPALGSFAGNISMQRYVQPGNTDWYFLGAPITAAGGLTLANWNNYFAMSGFPGSTDPSFPFMSEYTYNESVLGINDSGYVSATNSTNAILPGVGWECYVGPVPITITVAGPPVKGNFSFPVTYTPSSGGILNDGWNLIANPYPSTIDWNAGGTAWTKTNVAGAVYIWNPATSTYSSWVGGVGTNGGSNLLPSSQAFWIQTTGASPVLTLKETAKTTSDQVFFRTRPSANENTLKLIIAGNNYWDETAIRFSDSATIHYDYQFDAKKMYSLNPAVPSLATVADTFDLSINSMPGLTSGIVIPLRALIGNGTSGTYTISRDSILTLSLSTCLILEDQLTGIMTDLSTTRSYTFNIDDTTKAPRFLLHIGAPIGKQTFSTVCPSSNDGLAIAQGIGGVCTYTWKNAADSVIQVHANVAGNDTLANLSAGIYKVIITGNGGSCATLADTFAVRTPGTISPFASTTNVSCAYNSDGAVHVDAVLGGTAPYTYLWSNGASGTLDGGLMKGIYTLTITDAHQCSHVNTYTVSNGSLLHGLFTESADTVYLDAGAQVNFSDYSVGFTGFIWNFGDMSAADSLSLNPQHIYAGAGVYPVTLIVSDGSCKDTVRHTVSVFPVSPLGIHVPRPVNQSVNVISANGTCVVDFDLQEETTVFISVYDLRGAKVTADLEMKVYQSHVAIPLGEMARGVYLVSVHMNGKVITRKIFL
jgi:hypothetical protein